MLNPLVANAEYLGCRWVGWCWWTLLFSRAVFVFVFVFVFVMLNILSADELDGVGGLFSFLSSWNTIPSCLHTGLLLIAQTVLFVVYCGYIFLTSDSGDNKTLRQISVFLSCVQFLVNLNCLGDQTKEVKVEGGLGAWKEAGVKIRKPPPPQSTTIIWLFRILYLQGVPKM